MLRHGGLLSASWTTAVYILFCAVDLKESTIVVRPKDQCATVGETVEFSCSTDRKSQHAIVWKYRNSNAPCDLEMAVIYEFGLSSKRYSVSPSNEAGVYNLIINNVTSKDAGEFRCTEKDNQTEYKDACLRVKDRQTQDPATAEDNVNPSHGTRPTHDETPSEGSVDFNGEAKPVEQDSNRCTKEDAILGIVITNLVISIINVSLLVEFCRFRNAIKKHILEDAGRSKRKEKGSSDNSKEAKEDSPLFEESQTQVPATAEDNVNG